MSAYALFKKDLASELRTRYAINSLVMFIVVTISVILFSIGNEKISDFLSGGLFWVVIFFSAMSGLSRAFVSEEERGTTLTLQLIASPTTIFSGKLLFNLILVFAMNIVVALLYSALFDAFVIKNLSLFLYAFILGNVGIAIASTLIASIIAKASSKGTLYPVLSFPILLPLMLTLIDLTKQAMDTTTFSSSYVELAILGCYDVVMIAASFMLFDFIWKD
ncbi:MAG: ABC transporter permease [Ignavibacteria bacterium CG_4_8_14_3_um_filter_37_9]|nr:ABC transporter permease [Ignavibacteria bacterium]OIO22941.1 MAG: ABC transporter permease [Ignavibacteria bacterium CG1_02_37_35]PIP76934.1 MAG: ABC transporter permease [Ignavibacteria bacterium CG22_combo_CG10-13_8_21_14_all_37_15]PIS46353.1 MAG: ABC transporter permease [Ignavibacteria bacterium CG08_land_8_20_14_0_20_37_9]PIW99163.1 MAG: ABC transporter permease [Ignavibacteria bacterium CG_4_8_14_3_um_filter_37_9]PIX93443.1 MAG: ABC transporter permease [Ignavibacteria bacterium CG_4